MRSSFERRVGARMCAFALVAAAAWLSPQAACAGQFIEAAPMPLPRTFISAVALPSGSVLAAGGADGSLFADSMLYEPSADAWTMAAPMHVPHSQYTAVLLADGRVLVPSGFSLGPTGPTTAAEVYDPGTNTWTRVGDLATPRIWYTATRLDSGKVLIVGGHNLAGRVATAELFDPATGAWSAAGSLGTARALHAAARLPDGRVLVAGGIDASGFALASTEVYDPATNAWAGAAPMALGRYSFGAVALASGNVFAIGGSISGGATAATEIYDPATNAWTPGIPMHQARETSRVLVLAAGRVLAAGGSQTDPTGAEIYDPVSDAWYDAGHVNEVRTQNAFVALPSGKAIFIGGFGTGFVTLGSVEVFEPSTATSIAATTPGTTALGETYDVGVEVDSALGAPTGSVSVRDDAGASCGPVPLVDGAASCALTSTAVGWRKLTATYVPDDIAFDASGGEAIHLVDPAVAEVAIVSDAPDPSLIDEAYEIDVHVDGGASMPVPTGSITLDNGDFPCDAVLDGDGNAACFVAGFALGTTEWTAHYHGDMNYFAADSMPEPHTVARAPTTTTLASSVNPSLTTQPVTFFAEVATPLGVPSGSVTIGDGDVSCTAELVGNLASCDLAFAHTGLHEVTAAYSGDDASAPSVSEPVEQAVDPVNVFVRIDSAEPAVSVPGQPVTVAAEAWIDVPGSGTPPGPIIVTDDVSAAECTIPASGGSCDIVLDLRGPHFLIATYPTNPDFLGSGDLAGHRVNEPPFVAGETYASSEDAAIVIDAAQGVLANDVDSDGDPLGVVDAGMRTAGGIGGTVVLAADGSFSYTPPPDAFGEATFEYTVGDGYETDSGTAVLSVGPVNDPPSFALAASPKWPAGTIGFETEPSFATVESLGPPNEGDGILAWHVRTISDASGVLAGAAGIDLDGTLSYALTGRGGVATLGVTLQDTGGTANGGQDTSPEQTFTVTVGDGTDLSIAIEDDTTFVAGGDAIAYRIAVRNNGPENASGARVRAMLSTNLVDAVWTCAADVGASCAAGGSGEIDDLAGIPSGAAVAYTLTATALAMPELAAEVDATVTAPSGLVDLDPLNDSASDIDVVGIFADGFDTPGQRRDAESARAAGDR